MLPASRTVLLLARYIDAWIPFLIGWVRSQAIATNFSRYSPARLTKPSVRVQTAKQLLDGSQSVPSALADGKAAFMPNEDLPVNAASPEAQAATAAADDYLMPIADEWAADRGTRPGHSRHSARPPHEQGHVAMDVFLVLLALAAVSFGGVVGFRCALLLRPCVDCMRVHHYP